MARKYISLVLIALIILCLPIAGAGGAKTGDQDTGASGTVIRQGGEYAPEELIVRFTSPQSDPKLGKKVEKMFGKAAKRTHKITRDYTPLGLSNTYLIRLSHEEDVKEVKAKYLSDSEVVFAEPNYIVTIDTIPNDPSFSLLWGLHNTGQRGTADADIDAPEAWDLSTGSSAVVVAVIDTGVDYTHPDLAANIWTNPGEIAGDGIDNDRNGFIDDIHGWDFYNNDSQPLDDNGHGTHCAGTIGAVGGNGIGVTGVMWNTRIMPLKFMSSSGSGYTSDAVAAILYADMMGADVLSNSWGGPDYSSALESAIAGSPALVVCAAGNNGRNADTYPMYPAAYTCPQIVSVASYSPYDRLSSFSNYGPVSVDVAAPGEYIYSTLKGGGYGYKSGTSMATPHVAGLAGLLKSNSPGLSNLDLKAAILDSVDQRSSLTGKIATGGLINAANALSSLQPATLSVTGISPSSGYTTGPVSITNLAGTGFQSTPGVKLVGPDGTPEIPATGVTRVSSTRLTCTINLEGQPTGLYTVQVTNPGGEMASFSGFTILPPVPTISSLSPSSAGVGGAAFELLVSGTNFTPASSVAWNGSVRETVYDAGTLRATILQSDIASPGTAIVTVVDPERGISNGKGFTILPPLPAPTVSRIYPSMVKKGTTRSETIYGTNFVSGASAELRMSGQSPIQCTNTVRVNSGKLTCTIAIPANAAIGYWDVVVTNPDGQSGMKARGFRIY